MSLTRIFCVGALSGLLAIGCSEPGGGGTGGGGTAGAGGMGGAAGEGTPTCIASGDQDDINEVLTEPGAVAVLCQDADFELSAPVVLKDGQQIYTEGFPTDERRALLRIASASVVTAVDMADRSDVVLSNVVIDGSRPIFGHLRGEALIRAGGGGSGQVIREVKAFEPRTWSVLHLFEGGIAAGWLPIPQRPGARHLPTRVHGGVPRSGALGHRGPAVTTRAPIMQMIADAGGLQRLPTRALRPCLGRSPTPVSR